MVWIFSKCWLATVNEWWAGTCIFFNLFSVLISHRQYLAWGLVKFSTYLLSQSATVNIWLGDLWKFQLICWVNQSATVNIWLGDLWNFQLISILDSHLQYLAAGADDDANLSSYSSWLPQNGFQLALSSANGHIMLNAPVLVRSLKLSSIEPC